MRSPIPPVPDHTCLACRYLIANFCEFAQSETAPIWVTPAKFVPDPRIGNDCHAWDEKYE